MDLEEDVFRFLQFKPIQNLFSDFVTYLFNQLELFEHFGRE